MIAKAFSDFNPRSLAGATCEQGYSVENIAEFQSTLPRGSDLLHKAKYEVNIDFNPRSLAGATKRRN